MENKLSTSESNTLAKQHISEHAAWASYSFPNKLEPNINHFKHYTQESYNGATSRLTKLAAG